MKKKFFIFLFSFFFFFLSLSIVHAVGISGPVYEKMFFEPGLEKDYVYFASSDTDRVMDHDISLGGDLAPYFNLSTNILKDLAPGEERKFMVHMKLPQELEPGNHQAFICVTESEARGGGGGGGTGVGARARICGRIIVFAPYSGKHADFTFNVKNISKNENATFNLKVTNTGTEDIDIHGKIEVSNKNIEPGKEMKTITLYTQEKKGIKPGEETTLNATYNVSNMDVGLYDAKATLYYDGQELTKEKEFRIGELNIEIISFTDEVAKDKLNAINIKVKSKWNGPINGVYASIDIIDSQRNIVRATINSPPINLKPWEEKNIVAYWDTSGFDAGEYNAKITLHYEDKTTVKEGIIKIKEFMGSKISLTAILLFVLIIIILLLIILIIQLMKRKQKPVKRKKRKEKKKKIKR